MGFKFEQTPASVRADLGEEEIARRVANYTRLAREIDIARIGLGAAGVDPTPAVVGAIVDLAASMHHPDRRFHVRNSDGEWHIYYHMSDAEIAEFVVEKEYARRWSEAYLAWQLSRDSMIESN